MKHPKPEPKSRSGSNRSYAERMAKGRPNMTFSLPLETAVTLAELAEHYELSNSATVVLAIEKLRKSTRPK